MKDHIRPPVKVDEQKRLIRGPGKAWRWLLNVPASITGTTKQRLYLRTEKAANAKRDELLGNRKGLSRQQQEALAARGMTVEDAVAYALAHAPIVADKTMAKLLDEFVEHRVKEVGVSPAYLRTLNSYVKKLKESFGTTKIGEVTKSRIRKFLSDLKAKDGKGPAAPDTRKHYLVQISGPSRTQRDHVCENALWEQRLSASSVVCMRPFVPSCLRAWPIIPSGRHQARTAPRIGSRWTPWSRSSSRQQRNGI